MVAILLVAVIVIIVYTILSETYNNVAKITGNNLMISVLV